MKRFIVILLSFTLMVSVIPLTSYAVDSLEEEDMDMQLVQIEEALLERNKVVQETLNGIIMREFKKREMILETSHINQEYYSRYGILVKGTLDSSGTPVIPENFPEVRALQRKDNDGDYRIIGQNSAGEWIENPFYDPSSIGDNIDKRVWIGGGEYDKLERSEIGPLIKNSTLFSNSTLIKKYYVHFLIGFMRDYYGYISQDFYDEYDLALLDFQDRLTNGEFTRENLEVGHDSFYQVGSAGGQWGGTDMGGYIKIAILPTETSHGLAYLFHETEDGTIWYLSVLLASTNLVEEELIDGLDNSISNTIDPIITEGDLVIQSASRGSGDFNTTQGIPSGESVYIEISADEYIGGYTYSTISDSNRYTAHLTGSWREADGSLTPFSENVSVTRSYSYTNVDSYYVYSIEYATVNNDALPNGQSVIYPNSYNVSASVIEGGISKRPKSGSKNIGVVSRGTSLKSYARKVVGGYDTEDDSLIINGQAVTLGSDFLVPAKIDHNVLYEDNILVDETEANGIYHSEAIITYSLEYDYNNASNQPNEREIVITGNDVIVHTPVVCNGMVLNDKDYNQEITTDESRAAIILGKSSKFQFLTSGQHLSVTGYGNRDYRDYTLMKQVRFPFDIYMETTYRELNHYLAAYTWYTIPLNQEVIDYYTPIWVEEGEYEVDFRTIAINGSQTSLSESDANLNRNNYIATDRVAVKVIGRMYGFKVTDISDYPLWEEVFRDELGSIEHSGVAYTVGLNDENGKLNINNTFTLPIMEGSHPLYKQEGVLKTGYHFKFELETIGDYYSDQDCISIHPTFYYIEKDGTDRQEVDLYYHEYFQGKTNYFVKIDSEKNRDNTKYIQLGEPYRNVSDREIEDTCRILDIPTNSFSDDMAKIGWLDWLVLSEPLRTYVGEIADLPLGLKEDRVIRSKQHWYGEYYLPNDVFVAPKGLDVLSISYLGNGLDGREDFWLKDGYIIVNFEIETIKGGDFTTPILSYMGGTTGNMWEIEGYENERISSAGDVYHFENGDIILYDTDKKASDDYSSSGSH